MNLSLRLSKVLPNIFFLLLAIMAVVFYKERLFVDSSYIIFKVINKGWFHVEHGRAVLSLTQVLPLLAYYLHLPIKFILIAYSLNQVLLFYLLFLISDRLLKSLPASIGIMGMMVLGQRWLYYVPMVEIVVGGAFLILAFYIMRSEVWKDDKWLVLMLLSFWWGITAHPLHFITIFFLLSYDYLDRGLLPKIHYKVLLVLAIGLGLEVLGHDSYEAQKLVKVQDSNLYHLFDLTYLKASVLYLLSHYWHILFFGLFTTLYLISQKKVIAALIWPTAFVVVYLAANYRWDTALDNWYTEITYLPLVTISLALFGAVSLARLKNKLEDNSLILFSSFFLIMAVLIWKQSEPMVKRSRQIQSLTDYQQSHQIAKAVYDNTNLKRAYNQLEWSIPVEALLISSIDGAEQAVSLILESDRTHNDNFKRLSDSNIVFRKFEIMPYAKLNSRYFKFEKSAYQRMNTDQEKSRVKKNADKIAIFPAAQDSLIKIPHSQSSWVDVKLINQHSQALPSKASSNLNIAGHWYHADTLYEWDGNRTLLEVDLLGEHQQSIKLVAPEEKGIYELQLDMVKEGEFWLMLQPKYLVQVY